jgi:hypothetical protein
MSSSEKKPGMVLKPQDVRRAAVELLRETPDAFEIVSPRTQHRFRRRQFQDAGADRVVLKLTREHAMQRRAERCRLKQML